MVRSGIFSILYLIFYIAIAFANEQDYAGQEKVVPDTQGGVAPYTATFTITKDPSFTYKLVFGDKTKEGTLVCRGSVDCGKVKVTHEYKEPGVYAVEVYRVYPDDDGKVTDKSLRGLAGRGFVDVKEKNPVKPEPLCKKWFNGCVTCTRSVKGGEFSCPKKQCFGALLPRTCNEEFYVNKLPTVSISGPTSTDDSIAREWTVKGSDPEGEKLVYGIRWGDETPEQKKQKLKQSTATKFSHTYTDPGTYTITAYAKDTSGGVAKNTYTVTVRDSYAHVTCTREYVPVCGVVGGEVRTFSNECSMRKSRAKKRHDGAC